MIVQAHKRGTNGILCFFFSISGLTNEDVDSFICELMEGNDIKRIQSISLQGTDTIYPTEIVNFCLLRMKMHAFSFLEEILTCLVLCDICARERP